MALEEKNPTRNRISAFVIALSGYYIGYCLPIFNSMATPMFCGYFGLTVEEKDSIQGTLNFLFCFAGGVGTLCLGTFNDSLGRIKTAALLDISVVLVAFMFLSDNLMIISIARLFSGFLTGMYNISSSIILVEMMPAQWSSEGNMLICINTAIFGLITFVQQLVWSQTALATYWRLVMVWPVVLSVVRLVYMHREFTAESPVYIFQKFRNSPDLHSKLHESFSMIYKDTNLDQHIETYIAESHLTQLQSAGFIEVHRELLTERFFDKTVGAFLLKILECFTGYPFLMFFSTMFFEGLGMDGKFISFIFGLFYLVGAVVGLRIVDKYSRVTILLGGVGIQALSLLLMYLAVLPKWGTAVSFCLAIYITAYTAGYGGIAGLYISELLPAQAQGIVYSVSWLFDGLIGKVSLISISYIGDTNTLLLFVIFCGAIYFTLKKYLVEIKPSASKLEERLINMEELKPLPTASSQ